MKKLFISLFVISIFCNIYFAVYILGKGIVVNNYTTNHQEQYQQQWQGQLLINQWAAQGNTIEWKAIYSQDKKGESSLQLLNNLHPISSFYAKVSYDKDEFIIIYPDIFTKTKDVEVKK